MKINNLFEDLTRTGESKSAVVGWGRGMGHKGHMFLASSVVTHADELSADPYFVVSKTVGKDDPITPEEKLEIYKKVFPEKGHIFQTASDEMPDLTRVLSKLNSLGYDNVTVVVGADQKKALSYVQNYNGTPDKKGNIPYSFKELNVISRQETNDPNAGEEGPRATPMRDILKNPNASEEEKFKLWRSSMSPELSDQEVKDLMSKASDRMGEFTGKKDKVAESVTPDQFKKTMLSEVKRLVEEIKKDPYISKMLKEDNQDEDYYYVVRRQTEQDIELEMPSKMWTGLKPKHATYEEAKAAYEELKNKHPREKFTVTRHPRTSYIGGSPSQAFPEGVAEGKPKGYDSDGNPLGGGWDEYDNSQKSWTVLVNGKAWKTFDDERQAYRAADAIQQKYGKKTRVVSDLVEANYSYAADDESISPEEQLRRAKLLGFQTPRTVSYKDTDGVEASFQHTVHGSLIDLNWTNNGKDYDSWVETGMLAFRDPQNLKKNVAFHQTQLNTQLQQGNEREAKNHAYKIGSMSAHLQDAEQYQRVKDKVAQLSQGASGSATDKTAAVNSIPVDSNVQKLQQAILKRDPKALPRYGADGKLGKETRTAMAKYPDIAKQFPGIKEGKEKLSAQEKLYKKHQELRKKSGLPDPSEYKKKAAEKQKEIDDMKEAKTAEPPKPRNFVAKNAKTAGAGKHKDAKKAEKQGKVKHKAQSIPLDESKWGPAMKAYAKRNIP